jgi:hypothetical protein
VTLLNLRKAVDKKNDTLATAVVEPFISAFMDVKFLGSKRGDHRYTRTVMRGIMSKEGLESIAAFEEVTRSVDNVDNVSYWAEPEMDQFLHKVRNLPHSQKSISRKNKGNLQGL